MRKDDLRERRTDVALALQVWERMEPRLWLLLREAERYARTEATAVSLWQAAGEAEHLAMLLRFGPVVCGDDGEATVAGYRAAWADLLEEFAAAVKADRVMSVEPFHALAAAQAALEFAVPFLQAEARVAEEKYRRLVAKVARQTREVLEALRAGVQPAP